MTLGVKRLVRTAAADMRGRYLVATGHGPSADGPYKVFVIGSGRSGTHWVGHILEAFPETHVTIEKDPIFPWVVEMAQGPDREPELFPLLAARYRAEHARVLPKHYVDKSHPNLWIAERLAGAFPEARFVAIWRSLEGTVASMLRHDGVRHWVEAWDGSGDANRFLGVTPEFVSRYRDLSVAARCAVRVIAHYAEIERLAGVLGGRLHVISYDRLQQRHQEEIERLAAFLGLPVPADLPAPLAESRIKWMSQLTDQERKDIRAIAAELDAQRLLAVRAA
jgi:hypothetical protein